MKKLMVAALMVLSTSVAFAQADIAKQLSKIKNYAEAVDLLKSNLGSLSAEQKAKCYNALVDLQANDFNKAFTTFQTNQMMQKDEAFETASSLQAIKDAIECDIYDNQPNDKGKIAPKFHKKNQGRLNANRILLIIGGQKAQEAGKDDEAYEYYKAYTESGVAPLFEEFTKDGKDQNLGQVARVAAVMAYQKKDYAAAEKLVDVALNDPETAKDATNLKLAILGAQLTNHEDSVKYVEKLLDIYNKDTENDAVLSTLAGMYEQMGQREKAIELVDARVKTAPNNFTALALKGDFEMRTNKLDEAAETLKKALASENCPVESKASINAAIADCYFFKAQERVNNYKGALPQTTKQVFAEVFKQAIQYYEAARDLDVTKAEKSKWAYRLYSSYDFVYGENDPKTQAAATDAGM